MSVGSYSNTVFGATARGGYFKCVQHLRHSIRKLVLTNGMMLTGSYECLQELEKLSSLIVSGRNVVDNLTDCCEVIDNLHHLEELTVHFANNNIMLLDEDDEEDIQEVDDRVFSTREDESTSASIIPAATINEVTYPNIKKMRLYGYCSSTINRQNDMLHMQRFKHAQPSTYIFSISQCNNNAISQTYGG